MLLSCQLLVLSLNKIPIFDKLVQKFQVTGDMNNKWHISPSVVDKKFNKSSTCHKSSVT